MRSNERACKLFLFLLIGLGVFSSLIVPLFAETQSAGGSYLDLYSESSTVPSRNMISTSGVIRVLKTYQNFKFGPSVGGDSFFESKQNSNFVFVSPYVVFSPISNFSLFSEYRYRYYLSPQAGSWQLRSGVQGGYDYESTIPRSGFIENYFESVWISDERNLLSTVRTRPGLKVKIFQEMYASVFPEVKVNIDIKGEDYNNLLTISPSLRISRKIDRWSLQVIGKRNFVYSVGSVSTAPIKDNTWEAFLVLGMWSKI